jgi:hypothetical protein
MKDNFFITAQASWEATSGENGKALQAQIIARVMDQNGEPVTGLVKSNFTVQIFGASNTVKIENVQEPAGATGHLAGTYFLALNVPSVPSIGQFVFSINVKKVTKSTASTVSMTLVGQTLVSAIKLKP